MAPRWNLIHPVATMEHLGFIPDFLDSEDQASAKEQLNRNYSHGGGWRNQPGFTLQSDGRIKYPGDPPLELVADTWLREEHVVLYEDSWVAVIQPDGTYEVSRMD